MKADTKGKSTVRAAPYDIHRRRVALVEDPDTSQLQSRPLPLGALWQSDSDHPALGQTNNFVSHLSTYLSSKNESFKKELGVMEEALTKAEETSKSLKETVFALSQTVDALEDTLTSAAHILSGSLLCTICFEICTNPTSLRCGHSFCRDCLQSWFLTKFECRCEEYKIDLKEDKYSYIYTRTFTPSDAERNMLNFSRLSNRINPEYICPSCRDPLLPTLRNSYLDFKLSASFSTLSALIGYVPNSAPGWKLASVDMLAFLNSRFFQRDSDNYDIDIDIDL